MIEIDILKTSIHHTKPLPPSNYNNDDTDISEPDTALNTPTGSLTDSLSRRYSYNTCFKSYPQRKPSFTPKPTDYDSQQTTDTLEKRILALEEDINQHVKREADLQSQVYLLTEQQKGVQYKSTLTRISKQIDQFLVNHEEGINSSKSSGYWTQDWSGNEIPQLYGYQDIPKESEPTDTSSSELTNIPILLIYRLKSIMEKFTLKDHTDPTVQLFSNEFNNTLDSWQIFYHKKLMLEKQNKVHEQTRITRLLQALQKTILKNKLMKQDHNLLIKKYSSDMDQLVNQLNSNPSLDQKPTDEPIFRKRKELQLVEQEDTKSTALIRNVLESQIRTLEKDLSKCQDERDEYESTLEMVRREMETMLDELEDTRQQRLRYKTQASRLRAGLEAIQKRHQSDESENSNDESEDEGKEAIRLMYNEAERQAIDLDRECKRQALTLSGIRQELKTSQEKFQTIQTEKDTELKILQRTNQRLNRDIEMLRVEKHELVSLQQQNYQSGQSKTSGIEEDLDEHYYLAKIYALQTNLKASKCDAVMQRTKISQLERQATLVDISHSFVAGLQDLFQQETSVLDEPNLKEMADIIETEQAVWKNQCTKTFQKKYDIDLLKVNRELRFLSCKLNDVEDEMYVLKARHLEELSLLKYQANSEFQNKLQRITSTYRLREQELQSQLETLFQKNQTLKDESVILYGRNMLMAHQLGKIAP